VFIITKKVLPWQRKLSPLASQTREAAKRWAQFDVPVADKFSYRKNPTFFYFFATERGRMTISRLKLREGFAENSFSKLMLHEA
jgi:hypothetical protein